LKYAAAGNPPALRGAAFQMLAQIGKGDDRVLNLLTSSLKEHSLQLLFNAVQALSALGDARAIPALEEMIKTPPTGVSPGMAEQFVGGVINHLKNVEKAKEKKAGEKN
jgi:HEAT repeat protein